MLFRKHDMEGAYARKTFYWEDAYKGENVMWKLPRNVQWNDNVVVREDEWAVFFRDGKVLGVLEAGRYALTTQNVPFLARLAAAVTGVQQIGEVYYVQKRELRGKFGTAEPLIFRDTEFGLVRIRAFGQFSYKVIDPTLFITQFVGTMKYAKSEEIMNWLKGELIKALNDTLGELKRDKNMSVVDMPAYLQEMEQIVLTKVTGETERYGLKITKIADLNINLPEEVQQAVDKRGAMATLGVNYMQYQVGRSIENISQRPGEAGGMVGMGAGFGMGVGFAQIVGQSMQQPPPQQPPQQVQQQAQPKRFCPNCGFELPVNAKFCPNCGFRLPMPGVCPNCGNQVPAGAKFCPNCGTKIG